MLPTLLSPDRVPPLVETVATELAARAGSWPGREVNVFDELAEAYGAAVLRWAGIELTQAQARRWSRRLAAIVDGTGFAGATYARGWAVRTVANRWAARLVDQTRAGRLTPAPDTALAVIAGTDLTTRVAAVELLNVLRPTVAAAWPGTYAVLALAQHPEWRESLRQHDGDGRGAAARREAFDQEVRRLYPVVPSLAGRTRRPEPLTGQMLAETVGVFAELDYEAVSRPAYDPARLPTRPDRGLVIRVSR